MKAIKLFAFCAMAALVLASCAGKTSKEKTVKEKTTTESPLLKQYFEIKAQYPDAMLLYRVGDFYETFGEDAINLIQGCK